ncbi:hypothetical protein PFISCL1PPCAC_6082 [Pristionchus fissidentatus]|uniref:ZP domain-containing protein n=1 Tax=Pristionchus fissidentatus TaxID=1538716 RepID=A0AAV5V8C6_9BILA|nr:hypothetical protein PFISCL1PPCAC_6082 [Pristionchus fissidentatus]
MSRLLILLPMLALAARLEFDNSLTTAPKVSCDRGSLSLDISSSHGAPSVVFAKGHFNKEGCSFRNTTKITFDFDKCNIRRKREINPRRMEYSMTIVVQLHPLFITKVDRAYAVSCRYMEAEKSVGAGITVPDLTTQTIMEERKQPTCSYSLKKDSPNGPNLKYAQVGDSIYHVWECPSEVYSMLIHSCVVQDGQGQEQKVLDENGCSTDTYLMPELIYSKDLTKTFTASDAFNFPDVTSVQFSCQIKLCFKGDDGCGSITPPKCGNAINVENSQEEKNNEFVHTDSTVEAGEELEKDGLLSTRPSFTDNPIIGEAQDHKDFTSETSASTTTKGTTDTPISTTSASTTTSTEASTTTTFISVTTTTDTAPRENQTYFPTPKSLREFIKDKYGNTVEGSGMEAELTEREQKRDIKRRDTDTLDMDISSPELTILEKELAEGDRMHRPTAMSSLAPMKDSVCVPMTAFWLLIGLVLLSLSFILVAIYKASAKQGFAQF